MPRLKVGKLSEDEESEPRPADAEEEALAKEIRLQRLRIELGGLEVPARGKAPKPVAEDGVEESLRALEEEREQYERERRALLQQLKAEAAERQRRFDEGWSVLEGVRKAAEDGLPLLLDIYKVCQTIPENVRLIQQCALTGLPERLHHRVKSSEDILLQVEADLGIRRLLLAAVGKAEDLLSSAVEEEQSEEGEFTDDEAYDDEE